MVCNDTLRIKHLPKELSETQKEDFVRHFGAMKVRVITSKAKSKSVVYAKFENQEVAKNVMSRLHQLNILNCRLCVEYAETDILQGQLTSKKISDLRDVPDRKFFKNFINNINAFNDSVGFHQPPPSHLKYSYPKANRQTINNIAHALATVPRFYMQVLHLMNKMNLPPPFAMPDPPVRTILPSQHTVVSQKPSPANVPTPVPVNVSEKRKESSSESELESDGETNKSSEIIPQKRTLPQKKIVKRPKFIKQPVVQPNTTVSKSVEKPEDIFEKVVVQQPKKIELRVMPELPPEPQKQESVQKLPQKQTAPQKSFESEVSRTEQAKSGKNIEQKGVKPTLSDTPTDKPEKQQKLITEIPVIKASPLESKKRSKESPVKDQKAVEMSKQKIVKAKDPKTPEKTVAQTKETAPSISSNPNPILVIKADLKVEQHNQSARKLAEPTGILQKATSEELTQQKQDKAPEKIQEHQELRKKPAEVVQPFQLVEQVEPIKTEELLEPTSPDDEYPCISIEELKANQVTDLSVMPVFKNYNQGDPTNKLYIKNCAKTVVVQDLEYIYNRYREEGTEDKPSEFNIRLMQEGRMKGQAFVTLDSVKMAQKAVSETNGFILKDKPLVVVFGKAGKKK